MPPMKVVYTPDHLAHDVTHETYLGVAIPANEVAARAELIRITLEADGGFALIAPGDHGRGHILAAHHQGLVRRACAPPSRSAGRRSGTAGTAAQRPCSERGGQRTAQGMARSLPPTLLWMA